MTLFNKVKWILGILLVFFLVLMTNLIDRNNFVQVRESINTIYEDRLIANDLIIKMMREVHQKELSLMQSDSVATSNRKTLLNNDLQKLISRYEATQLTRDEAVYFESLQTNLQRFDQIEDSGSKDKLQKRLALIKEDLADLSAVQIDEGKNQMLISKKAVETVELFTDIEIYVLIVMAVIIQVIILYNPGTLKKRRDS